MAEPHATPHATIEEQSDKKHGDKLDHLFDQGTGLSRDASASKGTEPTPQYEPLK